jgi:hypothetical protein
MFGLFPVLLLSMLETGSPLLPFSQAVMKSFFAAKRGWTIFYLETMGLWAAALCAAGHVLQRWKSSTSVLLPILALLLTAVLIIYFRLLGRLGWYCGEVMTVEEEEQ